MKKIPVRQIRWGRVLLVLLAAALLVAGMNSCHGLIHYNGTPYRKRIVAFAAMTLVSALLAAYAPSENKRWKYSRPAYVILGIVAGGMAFQTISCGVFHAPPITIIYFPLMMLLSADVYLAVWLLVWDSRRAVIVYYWLMCLLAYAYECVYLFRGIAFKPADILAFRTALTVAGNYRFSLQYDLLFWCLGGVMLWALSGSVKRQKMQTKAARLAKPVGTVLAVGLIWVLVTTNLLDMLGVKTTAFELDSPYINRKFGTLTTLLKECQQMKNIRPDDYDDFQAPDERLLQPGVAADSGIRPNVLVIMNESLSDLAGLWDIGVDGDPLKYLHSIKDNAVYGNVYVSSYGGSTSTTEHSFLTATAPAPMLDMPVFTTAKTQTPSLPWLMKAQGYTTIAMHPFVPTNYQRDVIYPRLGFDQFLKEVDFEGEETLRTYITDLACYRRIILLYEQKAADERLFVFNVTMQNHGDYRRGGVEQRVHLPEGVEDQQLDEYLNLTAVSDAALEELIRYFSGQEEPTVILLFGDHQPTMDMSGFEKRQGLSDVEQQLTEYITPFVIWANYPIEARHVPALSVNYLAPLLQQTAGLPMTGYDQWLLDVAQKYPVTVLSGYADENGAFTAWNAGQWPEELHQMNHLRYNRLYDAENRLPALDIIR